jgi:hypothetical protein
MAKPKRLETSLNETGDTVVRPNESSYFWNDVLLYNRQVYKRVFGRRVLVQIVFAQGTNLCRSPFALERLLLLTDSYAVAYSINIELSEAQLSFSI